MRLIKLKLTNYRRFAGEHSLDLSEDVIALVGPNEAGKSSILSALELVGRGDAPTETDRARGAEGPARISALFALDPDDLLALKDVERGQDVRRVWVTRSSDSKVIWALEPDIRRDLRPRVECLQKIRTQNGLRHRMPAEIRLKLLPALSSRMETLAEPHLGAIQSAAVALKEIAAEDGPASFADLADDLRELAKFEGNPGPWRQAVDILKTRLPEVALFSPADRDLESTYSLEGVAANPPPALRNISAVAGLSLPALADAVKDSRVGRVERLLEAANLRLKAAFRNAWRQSPVYPRLSGATDGTLRVFVATEDGEYTFPEERSDGLRWFLALHAFLSARGQHEPILLVDEAETHLHYDAQADLVDALMNQQMARQVIYTTHSVGCLPPDLGCGIRVMLPEEGTERSAIVNSYWSVRANGGEKLGYMPLLFAMGARFLALTVPRFGVLVEGPSDAILLPSLLREAAQLDRLPYRVAPGLSEIAALTAESVPRHGGTVACLLDGDDGGKGIAAKLRSANIPDNLILRLSGVREGCTLEDLVDAKVFVGAVNAEMDMWGIDSLRISTDDLPNVGRWTWLVERGKETGTPVGRLSKSRVAQRIVDIGRNSRSTDDPIRLLDPDDTEPVRHIHERLCQELGVEL
jgi:AAA domain, putative AbiEii toxin, Type IV TA system/AAA ATPase domain